MHGAGGVLGMTTVLNPGGAMSDLAGLLPWAVVGGAAFVAIKSGLLGSLGSDAAALTARISGQVSSATSAVTGSTSTSTSNASCSGVPGGGSGAAACQAGCSSSAWTSFAQGLGINNECAARWFLEHGCQPPTSLSAFTTWRDTNLSAHGGHYYYCELP